MSYYKIGTLCEPPSRHTAFQPSFTTSHLSRPLRRSRATQRRRAQIMILTCTMPAALSHERCPRSEALALIQGPSSKAGNQCNIHSCSWTVHGGADDRGAAHGVSSQSRTTGPYLARESEDTRTSASASDIISNHSSEEMLPNHASC